MSVRDEATAEAERRWPNLDWNDPNEEYVSYLSDMRKGFVAGAEWQWEADEQREMTREITDREVEAAAKIMAEVTGEPRVGRFERTMTSALLVAAKEARE